MVEHDTMMQRTTKIKVAFNMAIDEYDQNGNVIKKVNEIRYFVKFAGDSATEYDLIINRMMRDLHFII